MKEGSDPMSMTTVIIILIVNRIMMMKEMNDQREGERERGRESREDERISHAVESKKTGCEQIEGGI